MTTTRALMMASARMVFDVDQTVVTFFHKSGWSPSLSKCRNPGGDRPAEYDRLKPNWNTTQRNAPRTV